MAARSKVTEEFLTKAVVLRGTTYRFREITGSQYEECVKMAEGEDGTADLATVLRLMIPLSLVEPKLTTEQIYNKPLPVVTAIQNTVNRMHFNNEPVKDADEEAGEDEAKNESEPQTSSL